MGTRRSFPFLDEGGIEGRRDKFCRLTEVINGVYISYECNNVFSF